jgi:hypothetical protein
VLVDPTGCWPSLADLKARTTQAGDAVLGFGYGLAAGRVPFVGNVLGALPPRTTEAFQKGMGVGQITGGVAQMIAGGTTFGGSVAGGVAGTAGTGGGGAPVLVVLSAKGAAVGAAMVASGMVAVAQGIQTLQMAGNGSSAGGGQKTAPEPEAIQHTPDQKALTELVDEASHGGRTPLPRGQAETVLDWAQEYKHPGARATPNDVSGNHPGTQWNGKPHIHLPGAGRGGHVPVEQGVKPR